jgi:hypothetical protein
LKYFDRSNAFDKKALDLFYLEENYLKAICGSHVTMEGNRVKIISPIICSTRQRDKKKGTGE